MSNQEPAINMNNYRYPSEQVILFGTVFLILVVLLLAAGTTLCVLPLFFLVILILSYATSQSHHRALIAQAKHVTSESLPSLAKLAQECARKLQPGPTQLFVVPSRILNAYTFGLESPKVIVLYSSLFQVMDADELRFIIGHEMGHAALGHTWLNTLLGGMAGVPPSFGAAILFALAFRLWNRACEYSADRAGLLACGRLDKAISALVKLVDARIDTPEEMKEALEILEQQDDTLEGMLIESTATHPLIGNRIEKLREWAASSEYQRLQALINRNATKI